MGKYAAYVVFVGSEPGVYNDWGEVGMRISGVKGALFNGYATRIEAEEAFENVRMQGGVRTVRTDRRGDEPAVAPPRARPRPAPCTPVRQDETVKAPPTKSEAVTVKCDCCSHHPAPAPQSRPSIDENSSPPTEVTQYERERAPSIVAQAKHSPRRDRSSASARPVKLIDVPLSQLEAPIARAHESRRTRCDHANIHQPPSTHRRRNNSSSTLSYVSAPGPQVIDRNHVERYETIPTEAPFSALATGSRESKTKGRVASPADEGRFSSSPPTDVSMTVPEDCERNAKPDVSVKPAMISTLSKGRFKPEPAGTPNRTSARNRHSDEEPSNCKVIVKNEPDGSQSIESQMQSPPMRQRTDSRAMRTKLLPQALAKLDARMEDTSERDAGNAPTRPASLAKKYMRPVKESSSPMTEVTTREPFFSLEPDSPAPSARTTSQSHVSSVSSPRRVRREYTEPSVGHASPRPARSRTHDVLVTEDQLSTNSPRNSALFPPNIPPGNRLYSVERVERVERVDTYSYGPPDGDLESVSHTRMWVQEPGNTSPHRTRQPRDRSPPLSPNITVRSPRSHRQRADASRASSPSKSSCAAMPVSPTHPQSGPVHRNTVDMNVAEHAAPSPSIYTTRTVHHSPEPLARISSAQESYATADDFPSISTYARPHRNFSSASRVARTSSEPVARVAAQERDSASAVARMSSEPDIERHAQSPARQRVLERTAPGDLQSAGTSTASASSSPNEAAAVSLPLSPLHGLSLGPPLRLQATHDLDPRSPASRGLSVPSRVLR
ncbi:hypothetical protein CERSUDRAFT_114488 [Gelatoporia subvermispora B]|uniref:Ribonuclease H1 N-terminal domain-containing protein n=1 Tax=Ceriporiopsis subvermispora (strain B) TaxID=914234 RepID=M2R006_CERS8|nr:hypothetical protein CERSUDRAFT_114488 [Gelatoporia subvermispora B]